MSTKPKHKTCQSPYCNNKLEGQRRKFCSYKCYDENRRGKWVTKTCASTDCNNTFKTQGQLKRYCSNTCNHREETRRRSREMKARLLETYGDKCACCGESCVEFLTLEHKNGDRKQHLKKVGPNVIAIWRDAVENFDTNKYEILCMNCNWAKGKYGFCPHERKK